MSEKLSAYMLTHNNERTVERAIQSLKFADEIIVVDSYSTDNTVDIVNKYTDKVIQRTWPGFRDQYQFAQDQCNHDWVVFIGGDEEISEELALEMQEAIQLNNEFPKDKQIQGFYVRRRTFYLNRWIVHGGWLSDQEVLLYRKSLSSWKGDLHAAVEVQGRTSQLSGYLHHYSYRNIEEQIHRINLISSRASDSLSHSGESMTLLHLIVIPPARFIKEYIFKLGFLDGMPGFIIAVNNCFYVFNKYAKLWEHKHCEPENVELAKKSTSV